jgi:hypothetical protein
VIHDAPPQRLRACQSADSIPRDRPSLRHGLRRERDLTQGRPRGSEGRTRTLYQVQGWPAARLSVAPSYTTVLICTVRRGLRDKGGTKRLP